MNALLDYFFAKIYELLNRKTFDSYRVPVHNPLTIYLELAQTLEKYKKKKIKNFDPTVTSIGEEAKSFSSHEYISDVFSFGDFSVKQVQDILEDTCVKKKDGKKNRTLLLLCKDIAISNIEFKKTLIVKIESLIQTNDLKHFRRIDTYASWLLSQLIHSGYSRKFINDRFHKCQYSIQQNSIADGFKKLIEVFSKNADQYEVLFKIKVPEGVSFLPTSNHIVDVSVFPENYQKNRFINTKFKTLGRDELYFNVLVESYDFWSALKEAHKLITESLEINILNTSDTKILLETQALIIHTPSGNYRMENLEELIDGGYKYDDIGFKRFLDCYKQLEESSVAKEKIRSAIKFYKLGNESVEIEHKILNYWIGFEQLFSSVDSDEDSIKRIKAFFVSMNSALYIQSRIDYLKKTIQRTGGEFDESKFDVTAALDPKYILISKRLAYYQLLHSNQKMIRAVIENHMMRLSQHITRIYRVRNELVHEGRSESISLPLVAGHLRHYLLFSIEQITIELVQNTSLDHLDDVFVYYENLLDRIKTSSNISEILTIKPYMGFME